MSYSKPTAKEINITVNSCTISTIIARHASDVDYMINKFLSGRTHVIGLDAKWTLVATPDRVKQMKKVAILQLCNGENCLIMQLQYFDVVPRSLFNFLQLPEFTFVGIGISDTIAELERDYGVFCKNVVEVGRNRIEMKYKPGEMHIILDQIGVRKWKSLVFDDWGDNELNEKQVYCATVDVFACRMIILDLIPNRIGWPLYKYN